MNERDRDHYRKLAALNNAVWCETVCRAHGCRTTRDEFLMVCLDRAPRFYPQAVTLQPNCQPRVLERVTGGLKDSFADVDLTEFDCLFEAQWIYHSSCQTGHPSNGSVVVSEQDLETWEAAWGAGDPEMDAYPRQFPNTLLANPAIRFIGGRSMDEWSWGAILNQSPGVVGISNVFSNRIPESEVWSEVIAMCSELFPNDPIVGYERGDSLQAAEQAGFESIGPLRVLLPRGA